MNVYVGLLRRNHNYRNLWFARVVSNLGDWFNLLASASLIARLTDSGAAVSLLFLVRFLPLFFMSPFAGVIADHFDRRKVLIATNLLRAATVAALVLVDRPDRIWLLYVLTALQFVFSAIFTPAETALIPSVVEEDDLITANALDSLTWSTMLAFGAMLGGLAAAFFGVIVAFLLDAISFLISAWFVSRVHVAEKAGIGGTAAEAHDIKSGMFAFVEGMRYLAGEPVILGIALAKAGGSLVWGGINVVEIPLAERVFPFMGNGSLTLGILYACTGIGTGIGPLLMRRWLGDSKPAQMRAIQIGFGALALGILGLALAPSLPWVLAATAVRAVGSGGVWVFSTVLLQQLLPDHVRGRVFAFEFAALTFTQAIGTLWAGYATDELGLSLQQVCLIAGIAGIATWALWLIFQTRVQKTVTLAKESVI
ncbi:MAG: MFS transporter [Caldilineaceae bacterium]